MVMHSRTSGQRGFMTAESLSSLFFYLILVAALAGVGSMLLSKSRAATAASALAIARANVSGEAALLDYNAAGKLPAKDATHNIADDTGLIRGVGTMTIVPRPTATAGTEVAININGVQNGDVCRALGSVGFGTWVAVAATSAPLAPSTALPTSASVAPTVASATGAVTKGLITTTAALEGLCGSLGKVKTWGANSLNMAFVTK